MIKRGQHFGGIDGLRTISCFLIIAMHIKANSSYQINSFFYNKVVDSWTMLVFLFLIISGFTMSVGYYQKIKNNSIDVETFYKKRIYKSFPFFALLITIDLLYDFNINNLIEGITELTFLFGLLPNNNLSVIGVSWTLGVIFLFYFLFPFFVFLIRDKKSAWFSLAISIVLNQFCQNYFFTSKFVVNDFPYRHAFIFCLPFFIVGGIIYLYLEEIVNLSKLMKFTLGFVTLVSIPIYYIIPDNYGGIYKPLIIFGTWLTFAVSGKNGFLDNRFMAFFSKISFEMYLAQMLIFRLIEKTIGIYVLGSNVWSYLITFVLTILGLVCFIKLYKLIEKRVKELFVKNGVL